ncbi:MAG TPA: hypothetical protein VJA21_01275 [Verrucomicrobiae bacterium]
MKNGQNHSRIGFVPPMLLRRVRQLPEGPQWHYEVKWDGYRMQAMKQGGAVRLISRNGADYTRRFPEVAQAVARLRPSSLHLDGELVAMDRQGRPSFQALQARLPLPEGWRFGYYAFDLLHLRGRYLARVPLAERRSKLEQLLTGSAIRYSASLGGTPDQVVAAVREQRLEGVVAKKANSVYEPGKRSGAWLKLPLKQTGHFFIGGFRPGHHGIGVLLVGQPDETGRFIFAGKVRQGLAQLRGPEIIAALNRLRVGCCPFANLPNCRADPFDEMVTSDEMST